MRLLEQHSVQGAGFLAASSKLKGTNVRRFTVKSSLMAAVRRTAFGRSRPREKCNAAVILREVDTSYLFLV
jgi:hypothetical protein